MNSWYVPSGRTPLGNGGHSSFHSLVLSPGEGSGSPRQRSCLENPRDGAAWWAAVCGVAQSRTRLRRLSSSSAISWSCGGGSGKVGTHGTTVLASLVTRGLVTSSYNSSSWYFYVAVCFHVEFTHLLSWYIYCRSFSVGVGGQRESIMIETVSLRSYCIIHLLLYCLSEWKP